MHRPFSLLVAVALATILGVGCGKYQPESREEKSREEKSREEKSEEEKVNEAFNNPELKVQLDAYKTLVGDRLKTEGFAQDKVGKYLGAVDSSYEEFCQEAKADLKKAKADIAEWAHLSEQNIQGIKEEWVLGFQDNVFRQAIMKISNREDLIQFSKRPSLVPPIAELISELDKIGMSNEDIAFLRKMILDNQFIKQLINSSVDLFYVLAQQIQGI